MKGFIKSEIFRIAVATSGLRPSTSMVQLVQHCEEALGITKACAASLGKYGVLKRFLERKLVPIPNVDKRPQKAKKAKRASSRKMVRGFGVNPSTDEFLLSFEWRRLRMQVLQERGRRCECCGAIPSSKNTVTVNVDHIKPRKFFPELALDKSNLQVLCGDCNHGKGNWDQTDWREEAPPKKDVPIVVHVTHFGALSGDMRPRLRPKVELTPTDPKG